MDYLLFVPKFLYEVLVILTALILYDRFFKRRS